MSELLMPHPDDLIDHDAAWLDYKNRVHEKAMLARKSRPSNREPDLNDPEPRVERTYFTGIVGY
ncbi:MAG: hypothetical protein OXP73_09070 [Chloroflexota bacterium]|nr:hypothetical protein [Chloroflexota bacterium]